MISADAVLDHVLCATDPLLMIDILATGKPRLAGDFVIISSAVGEIDFPASLGQCGKPLILALKAFKRAGRTRSAYVQGRGAKRYSELHMSLCISTLILHELPYTICIALRALRADIQVFVAKVAFRLVTSAPSHGAIDRLFETCLSAPLEFDMHSKAWSSFKRVFQSLSCSAAACSKDASIVVSGCGLKMARRDVILVVMGMIFSGGELGPLGAIVARASWLGEVRSAPSWM
jgi:hypothetical protein